MDLRQVFVSVLCAISVFVFGCSRPQVSDDTLIPQAHAQQMKTGPYLSLLAGSVDRVQEALGAPGKKSEQEGLRVWEYEALGVTFYSYQGTVMTIQQTSGIVSDSLTIGMTEDSLKPVVGELEPSVLEPGTKLGRIYVDKYDILVKVRQGKVQSAEVQIANGDH